MTETPTTWSISSDEAERCVLGGVLLRPSAFADCNGEVAAQDFYHPANAAIWAAMTALDGQKSPIDPATVWQKLGQLAEVEKLHSVGGQSYFSALMADVVTVENIGYHARIVARLAERRRMAEELVNLASKARSQRDDTEAFFDDVEARMLHLLQQRRSVVTLVDAKRGVKAVHRELEERQTRRREGRPTPGIRLGFDDFDRMASGLKPGQLVVVAARPSVGKSAFMGNVVEHIARTQAPTLVFSLEMTAAEIFERMFAAGGISADHMRAGALNAADWQKVVRVAGELTRNGRVYVDDSGSLAIGEIRSRARRWRAHEGKGDEAAVFVDYLQLVNGSRATRNAPREQIVAEVSRGLKNLAKELRCPVVALAQLNRAVENRADRRPTLADLRESGQIEQDADIVAFLYREDVANPKCSDADRGTAELIIAKGRGMPIGTVKLRYEPQYVRFSSVYREQQQHWSESA